MFEKYVDVINPEAWEVLFDEQTGEYHLYGGWVGGYLSSSAWRRSSPVRLMRENDNMYCFTTYSGTEWHVKKYQGRMDMYCRCVLDGIIAEEKMELSSVESLLKHLELANETSS